MLEDEQRRCLELERQLEKLKAERVEEVRIDNYIRGGVPFIFLLFFSNLSPLCEGRWKIFLKFIKFYWKFDWSRTIV